MKLFIAAVAGLILLFIVFGAGVCTGVLIGAKPVAGGPMPAPSPAVPKSQVIQAKQIEIIDESGKVQLVLTGEGGPAAIVNVNGKAVRMDLAKLTRYAQSR